LILLIYIYFRKSSLNLHKLCTYILNHHLLILKLSSELIYLLLLLFLLFLKPLFFFLPFFLPFALLLSHFLNPSLCLLHHLLYFTTVSLFLFSRPFLHLFNLLFEFLSDLLPLLIYLQVCILSFKHLDLLSKQFWFFPNQFCLNVLIFLSRFWTLIHAFFGWKADPAFVKSLPFRIGKLQRGL